MYVTRRQLIGLSERSLLSARICHCSLTTPFICTIHILTKNILTILHLCHCLKFYAKTVGFLLFFSLFKETVQLRLFAESHATIRTFSLLALLSKN